MQIYNLFIFQSQVKYLCKSHDYNYHLYLSISDSEPHEKVSYRKIKVSSKLFENLSIKPTSPKYFSVRFDGIYYSSLDVLVTALDASYTIKSESTPIPDTVSLRKSNSNSNSLASSSLQLFTWVQQSVYGHSSNKVEVETPHSRSSSSSSILSNVKTQSRLQISASGSTKTLVYINI